ncbi:hypothetical protein [Acinetobacter vivianii]|uniref:hypothetical protein n=1 Tax=Acinetobacter vivianii TaxID=1776742 RepID=UPI0019062019|nr:hypothetical protein [Acinetobacter vivianii]MBJ8483961.1 hypothetical protein [Acinetobacter vivianii]
MNYLSPDKLITETIGEELEHLSENQLIDLIAKYKNGNNVENLLKEFNINIRSTMLVRSFPLIRVGKCPNCPADLGCSIANKTSKELLNQRKEECWNCGHKPYVSNCQCSTCLFEKEQERIQAETNMQAELKRKKEAINKEFCIESYNKVDEDSLTLKEKISICTILRCCLSEDGRYIKPIKTSIEPVTSHQDLTTQMIKHLIIRGILVPSVESDINAFVFDETNTPSSYYTYEVKYILNIQPKDKFSLLIERLLYLEIDIDEGVEVLLSIWKDLAFYEVLSYFLYQMNDVGYQPNIGEVTKATFIKLLEHFSVGQIFNIVLRAVSNSTRAYQSGEYTKKHAMNMVVASCRNQGEKAIAENWDLKAYNRIKQLPESELSKLLFTAILKKPYMAFNMAPTFDNLLNLNGK